MFHEGDQDHAGEKDFVLFSELPALIYKPKNASLLQPEDPDPEHLAACFVLLNNTHPVARVAVYLNPDQKLNGIQAASLGNYECTEDPAAAGLILEHASNFVRHNGAGYMLGPMNGSTWNSYRFCADNIHPPFFLEPWQPAYYNDQFRDAGLDPIANYLSSIEYTFDCDDDVTMRLEKAFLSKGIVFRSLKKDSFDEELANLYPFLSKAFSENVLYTPISFSSFCRKYGKALNLISQELTIIAEDGTGKICGLVFCYDDPLSSAGKRLVVKTIARDPSFRYAGLGNVLANMVIRKAKTMGYTAVLHALMHEKAASLNLSKRFKGEVYRRYTLYGKKA